MKTSIGQIRRADLTKAAYYVMLEHGLEGTTVARVGEKAGMSHGIVNYHFKNKMELIHAVVKYANRLIGDKVTG
ncbi:TetR/AcrR family transcriptional regulator [Nitrincola nitratireducens]|uniref:Transcriptional regulator BetI n=3 Tax=Nitrincola TaxID=267849 RepID=W9V3E0_9GAMM|nr:TetR family transcriptional regulator [Nitrincola nitratireducens]EXJ11456.1 transcriptional regulator BetI [Nitrincola nitratireducens]